MSEAEQRREHWIPDDKVSKCESCQAGFSLIRRKHHCRFCGHIFCAKCSSTKMELPEEMGYNTPERVCQKCIPVIKGARRAAGTHEKPSDRKKGGSDKGVEDMVMLSNLSEEEITSNLATRYKKDLIYTYIGQVLVSVNPFKLIRGLYDESTLFEYRGKYAYELPPHVYMIAEQMYRNMQQENESQCVIISGESGAGKTEASKKIMQYFAAVSGKGSDVAKVKDVILQSNPLLEAFGNAKTIRNNNSSRFGKYMEILFDRAGDPRGGNITNYLLEKSRICFQAPGERWSHFHIFYQLCKGMSPEHSREFGLDGQNVTTKQFSFTSQSGCDTVDTIDDVKEFAETVEAMSTMGFDKTEQLTVLRVVLAILFIGNIEFQETDKEESYVKNKDALEFSAYLLYCQANALEAALITRTMTSGSSRASVYSVPLNSADANYGRDAFAKSLYSRLFDRIVSRVNDNLYTAVEDLTTLSVLDIYGFEIFEKNGFEQLCINYVNEKLQQIFINLTLKEEQDEYKREQIKWTPIDFFNNKICCDLIESKKPAGVFTHLDDTVNFPKATDEKFLQKCTQSLSQHAHFAPSGVGRFLIKHYAGDVIYDCDGFCDKNKDVLFDDLILVGQMSESNYITTMFPEDCSAAQKKRPTTAAFKIKTSITALTEAINKCTPHYIRCVKPNEKKANIWDNGVSKHQVRYLGLLENVKVRRAGFAYRAEYSRFFYRYRVCSHSTWPTWNGDHQEGSKKIIGEVVADASEIAFGTTKVFIKHPETVFALEELREQKVYNYATSIQNFFAERVGKGEYMYKLVMGGYNAVKGQKDRRRESLDRKYKSDYIQYRENITMKSIVERFGDEKVIFADQCFTYTAKGTKNTRALVVTDKAFYFIGTRLKKGTQEKPVPPDTYHYVLFRRLELNEIDHFTLSPNADNFVLIFSPTTSDYIFDCRRKTEIFGQLSIANCSKRIEFSASSMLQMREKHKTKKVQVHFQGGGNGTLQTSGGTFSIGASGGMGKDASPSIKPPTGAGGGFAQFSSGVMGGSSGGGGSSSMGRAPSHGEVQRNPGGGGRGGSSPRNSVGGPRGGVGGVGGGMGAPRGGLGGGGPPRGAGGLGGMGAPRGAGGMGAPRGAGGPPRGAGGPPRGAGSGPPRGAGGMGAPRGAGGPPRGAGGPPRGAGGMGAPRGAGGPPRGAGGMGAPRGAGGPPRGAGGMGAPRGGGGPPRGGGPPSPRQDPVLATMSALWDFNAENPDELSFRVGDKIDVLKKPDADWWECRITGSTKKGMAPSNYLG